MPSPNLALLTTDLAPEDVFDILGILVPDFLAIDSAVGWLGAGANLLVNPRFTVWQRQDRLGVTSWTAHGDVTADRWGITLAGASTMTVTRLATGGGLPYALRADYAHAVGGGGTVEQLVEQWIQLRGRTVSLRMRVKASVAAAARLVLSDGVSASAYSAHHSGGGAYEALSATLAVDAAATTLKVGLILEKTVAADVDQATLMLGSVALPCPPLDPEAELRRCERYFEVHGGSTGFPYVRGYSAVGAGDVAAVGVPFRVRKGGTPTVTKAGTWGVNNAGQPTIPNSHADGYMLQIASLATGYFDAAPNGSDDLVYGEWNPS
jgi:hypothetical protein